MHAHLKYRLNRFKRSLLAKLVLFSPAFGPLLATPTPLLKMEYVGGERSRRLIVFLPGIDDLAEDFARRGFIDELQRHRIAADAVAIDAHYGYYAGRVIHERLTEDVLTAAHAAGYVQIWLAGVSLGGFGAASYAARHPARISGLLLFAPYLGGSQLIGEIDDAGGMQHWEPGAIGEDDHQRALWAWLKRHFAEDDPALPIYLGYGERDMFARANGLLAQALPPERVFRLPGGHDWRVWKKIWQMFLAERKEVWRRGG
jgi:pimeloyl-ACP methyl ester carboxylesterase